MDLVSERIQLGDELIVEAILAYLPVLLTY